jgi:hypothetical protein
LSGDIIINAQHYNFRGLTFLSIHYTIVINNIIKDLAKIAKRIAVLMSTLVCPKSVTDSWSQATEAVSSMSMKWIEYRSRGDSKPYLTITEVDFALCIALYLNAPIRNAFRLTKDWVKQIMSGPSWLFLNEKVKNELQLTVQVWGNLVDKYVANQKELHKNRGTPTALYILPFSDIVKATQEAYQQSMKAVDLFENGDDTLMKL